MADLTYQVPNGDGTWRPATRAEFLKWMRLPADTPEQPLVNGRPPAFGPYALTKLQIIDRMTDEQVALFDAMLTEQPPRLRRAWADCQEVRSDHPFRVLLHDAFTQHWGAAEADRILAR